MEHGVLRGNRPTPASPWILLGVPQWSSGYFKANDPRAAYVRPSLLRHDPSVPHTDAFEALAGHSTHADTTMAQAFFQPLTAVKAQGTSKSQAARWWLFASQQAPMQTFSIRNFLLALPQVQ